MANYNDAGIRIRYLFYPRAGIGSDSYDKAVSVWCADDRKAAMDKAKAGGEVERKTCDNPVDEHMAIGEQIGLRGTPAIVTETGELIPGYVEPKRLAARLNGGGATASR
jgi:thiol:disulfide interchange protein DsbC